MDDVAGKKEMNAGFSEMQTQFKEMDLKFADMQHQFKEIDLKFAAIDVRFKAIDARFKAIDARFDMVDARFDALEARFENEFVKVHNRIDGLSVQIQELKNLITDRPGLQFLTMVKMMGMLLATLLAVAAALPYLIKAFKISSFGPAAFIGCPFRQHELKQSRILYVIQLHAAS